MVFGTSQYFVYVDPAKKTPKDPEVTFESIQDEIGKATGVIVTETENLSGGNWVLILIL